MTRLSIKTKLTWAFAFLGLLPLLLLGVLTLYVIDYTHRQDVATMENQLLAQKSAEVQKFLDDTAGLFEIKVGYNSSAAISDRDQKFLLESLLQNPSILEAEFINTDGQEAYKISSVQDTSFVPLANLKSFTAFQKALAGQIYFGPVEQTLSGPLMTVAGPVTSEGGTVVMVVIGKISLEPLVKTLSFANLGNSGYLYLVDQSGYVVGSAEKKYLGKNLMASAWIKELLSGRSQDGLGPDDRRTGLGGQTVLAAGKALPKQAWALVAEWPEADAFALTSQLQNQIGAFLAVVFLAVLGLGWLAGRQILRPLKALEAAAERLGEGKFDFNLDLNTGDELEELGRVINHAAADLKRLQELKEEFVFIAAHELRTPVTATKGYLSMISGGDAGPVPSAIKPLIEQVQNANQRLVQLVEDLLQVARNDAGRLTIALAPTDLGPCVDSVIAELQPLAAEKHISVEYQTSALPKISADSQRLKEILVNLVGNAIKYTPNGGKIKITHELNGNEVITHIADTGIGMTAEERAHLFEKFYRIKNTETSKISGTGLGLFIVKQIVEKMQGRIWVISEKGQGSTFSFAFERT